jgi:hypothetical protein
MAKSKFNNIMMGYTPDDCEIRHVQPYQATKKYICPYCNNDIEIGLGHEVIVPIEMVEDRRHFHSGCWKKYLNSFNTNG